MSQPLRTSQLNYDLSEDQHQILKLVTRVAKVVQIIKGTNQIQRNIIADSVLGRVNRRR